MERALIAAGTTRLRPILPTVPASNAGLLNAPRAPHEVAPQRELPGAAS